MEAMLDSMQTNYKEQVPRVLFRVYGYRWFSEEFRAAGGFDWLIKAFPWPKKSEAATIICMSLDVAEEELDVVSWMQEFYNLLLSYHNIGGYQDSEAFEEAVTRVYEAQRQLRETLPSAMVPVTVTASHGSPNTIQDATHAYVLNWSDEKWSQWCDMIEEIYGGLHRGYVCVAPSVSSSFLFRDPDGVCCR